MFKNLVIFKINAGWDITHHQAIEAVAPHRFKPTLPTQDKSYGWVEPRGEDHADLVESVDGQLILKLMMETRAVPGGAVRKKAQEEADRIEAETGRKPGKKETLKLREDALLSLLPNTYPTQTSFWVWIDRENGCVAIDASSQGKVDDVVTALVRAFGGMAMTQLKTALSPATAMTQWLLGLEHGDSPENFSVDRDCELKSTDQEKSSVKFNRHNLDCEEVRNHLVQGMAPTKLALTWGGRVSFQLTEAMVLKKLSFLEGVFENLPQDRESSFDGDVALFTGELKKLIPDLVAALGGPLAEAGGQSAADNTSEDFNDHSAHQVDTSEEATA